MSVYLGCAAMSETLGNLLIYTNGFTVWNKNHHVILNGNNLQPPNSTPQQSGIIIPKPGSDKIYYIFHLRAFNFKKDSDTAYQSLAYSIVDMTLDNGLGAVTLKGVKLLTPVSEAL